MRLISVFVLIALSASPAAAQATDTLKELGACRVIESDLRRLACYDELAGSPQEHIGPRVVPDTMGAVADILGGRSSGRWVITEEVDPMDDSRNVMAILLAEGGMDRPSRAPSIAVRCRSGRADVILGFSAYMSDNRSVALRYDNNQPKREMWRSSADKAALFAPKAREFVESLIGVNRLVAQASPYNRAPVSAVFEVGGVEGVIEAMAQACKW